MVRGWGGAYVGDVPSQVLSDGTVIPPMHHHDGPQGVANGNTDVTCWPSALTVVQSWDPELMAEYGAGMGLEQVSYGARVSICSLRQIFLTMPLRPTLYSPLSTRKARTLCWARVSTSRACLGMAAICEQATILLSGTCSTYSYQCHFCFISHASSLPVQRVPGRRPVAGSQDGGG